MSTKNPVPSLRVAQTAYALFPHDADVGIRGCGTSPAEAFENAALALHVHREGATRALGPGHSELPEALRAFGQPALIGGSMAVGSYVLAGLATAEAASLGSACHGAGRALSRHQALKQWSGRKI